MQLFTSTLILKSLQKGQCHPQFSRNSLSFISLMLKNPNVDIVNCGFSSLSYASVETEDVLSMLNDGEIILYLTNLVGESQCFDTEINIINYFSKFCTFGDQIIFYFIEYKSLQKIKIYFDLNNLQYITNFCDLIINFIVNTSAYVNELFELIVDFPFNEIIENMNFKLKERILHLLRICFTRFTTLQVEQILNIDLFKTILSLIDSGNENILIYDSCFCVLDVLSKDISFRNEMIELLKQNDVIQQLEIISNTNEDESAQYASRILSLISENENLNQY